MSVPFKWYPGTRVLTQAFLWRLLDLTETRRASDRHGRGDEVPVLRRAAPREARLARAPVPPGVRARPDRARPVLGESPRIERCAARCRISTAWRSARRARLFATSRQRRRPTGALDGARRRGAATSRPGARLPRRRPRRLRPLRQPARSRQAGRPADRGRSARAVAPGRRRRRRPRRRPARAARSRPRAQRPGPLCGTCRATELADLYATCFASFYAPVDEDFGLGPYESFLSGKPVITATDAGGPLDVVHDGSTGRVVDPEARAVASAAVWLRDHPERRWHSARPGRRSRSRSPGTRSIGRLLS